VFSYGEFTLDAKIKRSNKSYYKSNILLPVVPSTNTVLGKMNGFKDDRVIEI